MVPRASCAARRLVVRQKAWRGLLSTKLQTSAHQPFAQMPRRLVSTGGHVLIGRSASTSAATSEASVSDSTSASTSASTASAAARPTATMVERSYRVHPALNALGNASYLAIASGFLMTDLLALRALLSSGYLGLVCFHSLQKKPLWVSFAAPSRPRALRAHRVHTVCVLAQVPLAWSCLNCGGTCHRM